MIETFIIDILRRSVVPQARRSSGLFFVEYGRPFKIVGIAAWLLAFGAAVLALHPSTKIEPLAVPTIIGLFAILALYLHSEFFHVRLVYGDSGITVRSRWCSERKVLWTEIVDVKFSALSHNYVVRLRNGGKFTFSYFMSGYGSLLEELRNRGQHFN